MDRLLCLLNLEESTTLKQHLERQHSINDTNTAEEESPLTVSGSHWAFIHNMFYRSGSSYMNKGSVVVNHNEGIEKEKFNSIYHNHNEYSDLKPFHKNKFSDSASVFYIPQQYFGQRIEPKSFQLNVRTGSLTNTTRQLIIKDDGNGNLYAPSASISRSGATSISSSDNYVGNIYYDLGVVVLTETASALHTPSTASFTVKSMLAPSTARPSPNHFFITSSALSVIKFISTGSSETDTATVKYFASASTLAVTVASASSKVNDVFGGNHITASVSASTLHLTNDANQLNIRITSNSGSNLGAITGAGAFTTSSGFGGGSAAVKYTDIGGGPGLKSYSRNYKFYELKFNSMTPIFTSRYSIKIPSSVFNTSVNPTVRGMVSGSIASGSSLQDIANIKNNLTGSDGIEYGLLILIK